MAARFVVCASTSLGDVSGEDLILGRLYEVLGEETGMLRIVDASGEDYLYPKAAFEDVELSEEAEKRLGLNKSR